MEKEVIYFELNTRIPQTLYGTYRGRTVSTGLAIVPSVIEAIIKQKPLSDEETIIMAEDYLRNVLIK